MHLVVGGRPVVIAPVVLSACVDERNAIAAVAEQLARLERLLSALPDTATTRWTVETLLLRDALIALDGYHAGATLPEIAAVIYGEERIERDWPGKVSGSACGAPSSGALPFAVAAIATSFADDVSNLKALRIGPPQRITRRTD